MNRLLIYFFILFSASLMANIKEIKPNKNEQLISLEFNQTDITIILQTLAEMNEYNLVMPNKAPNYQSIKLNNISWQKALNVITNNANLSYVLEDNLLIINDNDLTTKTKSTHKTKKTKSFNIQFADIKQINSMIQEQKLLSENADVLVDERTHTLTISDEPIYLNKISDYLLILDKPMPQIHIEAHIVTMSNESVAELGIKWNYESSSSSILKNVAINSAPINPINVIGINFAKRATSLLNLELSALESENQLEIIASPNLLTTHQNMASIKQGTQIPYEISNGSNGGTSIEFKHAVLGLEVTPKIINDKLIELHLIITQNAAGRTIKGKSGSEALAIDTQEIKTKILVKTGETIVLGGIFQQTIQNVQNGVPVLQKIPLLGALFKYQNKRKQKRELVIFVTPKLVIL